LIADIGRTYARFALEAVPGRFDHTVTQPCADHLDFHAAVTAYLQSVPATVVRHAAVAIANPVEGDEVGMTNYHWRFSIEQMRERLGLETLVIVNDFTALAMALPRLAAHERRQVGPGMARPLSVVGLLGSGSGLGMSGLVPVADGWVSLGSEGGHTSFAPQNELELAILRHAWQRHPHVSSERLLSGPGLELIHEALCAHRGLPARSLPALDIIRHALQDDDAACAESLQVFCAMLGTAAADLALTLGALGGVYIGGGIVPRLGEYFDRSPFRQRFEEKGRFSAYLADIPTFVITAESPTFVGASAILDAQLRRLQAAPVEAGSALLGQIRRARLTLSPAERRVADHVLAHPRSALNDPIAAIARAAAVSQPTVIRFCRSLGCEGLSDFKLRLASGLSSTIPVTHSQVTHDDNLLELGSKVLGNTASAILQVRDHLNRDMIARAIDLLLTADRVDFYAVGHYAPVAQDAQFKFLRFGIASAAFTDARLLPLAANVLKPGNVAVIFSSSGRVPELVAVADKARERGASVVAITASQSPLSRKADAVLIVDHVEDITTHLPMISRILHLLVVDILTVGVAMQRGNAGAHGAHGAHEAHGAPADASALEDPSAVEAEAAADGPGARPRAAGAGHPAPTPLARLTSHSR
jgi:glucokinase